MFFNAAILSLGLGFLGPGKSGSPGKGFQSPPIGGYGTPGVIPPPGLDGNPGRYICDIVSSY